MSDTSSYDSDSDESDWMDSSNSKSVSTSHPETFPCLPDRPSPHTAWSANIHAGYRVLANLYQNAAALLRSEDVDPLQVSFHINAIASDAVPLLSAMEMDTKCSTSLDDSQLPSEWLHHSAKVYGSLVHSLQHIGGLAQGRFVTHFN